MPLPRAYSNPPPPPNNREKRLGVELARSSREGGRAVSDASKEVVYVEVSTYGQIHVMRSSRTETISPRGTQLR